jgi:uncharacterized protein YerC
VSLGGGGHCQNRTFYRRASSTADNCCLPHGTAPLRRRGSLVHHAAMTKTFWTILLVISAGLCEMSVAVIAFNELRSASSRVQVIRRPQYGDIYEVLATNELGVNTLMLDRVARAVLEQWQSNKRSRIAVTVLVPLGIIFGTAAGILGSL